MLAEVKKLYPRLPVILMTAYLDLGSTVSVYEGGALEYVPKPFDVDDAVEPVRRAIAHSMKKHEKLVKNDLGLGAEIIGDTPEWQEVFRSIG